MSALMPDGFLAHYIPMSARPPFGLRLIMRRRFGRVSGWFLTRKQRGNPATSLPDWSTGNLVEPLIHGAAYFDRLATEVEALAAATICSSPTGAATPTNDARRRPYGRRVVRRLPNAASSSRA